MPRIKEFDPELALDRATILFWKKGYASTSMRDLITATGVNQYGLYSVFKDKFGLFMKSLDHYETSVSKDFYIALQTPGSFKKIYLQAVEKLLDAYHSTGQLPGCLITNTAIEFGDQNEEIRQKIRQHFDIMYSHVHTRLQLAEQNDDTIDLRDIDTEAAADLLTNTIYSIGLQLRQGSSRRKITTRIELLLSTLLAPKEAINTPNFP